MGEEVKVEKGRDGRGVEEGRGDWKGGEMGRKRRWERRGICGR